MQNGKPIIEIEHITDPQELAAAREQREQFDRNSAWLQAHIPEIYSTYRGKCICIAGQEVFVGDTAREAVAKAVASHPDDAGMFTRYIPKEKLDRIDAFNSLCWPTSSRTSTITWRLRSSVDTGRIRVIPGQALGHH